MADGLATIYARAIYTSCVYWRNQLCRVPLSLEVIAGLLTLVYYFVRKLMGRICASKNTEFISISSLKLRE